MSSSAYGFLFNKDLPSEEEIVALCQRAGYEHGTGIRLLDQSSQSVIAWIKYGLNVTVPEARTQAWTAKALNDNPASGLRVPRVYHAFTRQHPWHLVHRFYCHGVYRRSRLRLGRRSASGKSCSDVDRPPSSGLYARARRRRRRFYCTLLRRTVTCS